MQLGRSMHVCKQRKYQVSWLYRDLRSRLEEPCREINWGKPYLVALRRRKTQLCGVRCGDARVVSPETCRASLALRSCHGGGFTRRLTACERYNGRE